MSRPCPNATLRVPRATSEARCKPTCLVCRGWAYVIACGHCEGCGMKLGVICTECNGCGLVSARQGGAGR